MHSVKRCIQIECLKLAFRERSDQTRGVGRKVKNVANVPISKAKLLTRTISMKMKNFNENEEGESDD